MSHPAWVCGLKLQSVPVYRIQSVTPCVGVWIETPEYLTYYAVISSHPAWVCGLKPLKREDIMLLFVTPCVGVWIETYWEMISDLENGVTPCVGVWIETLLE